MTLSTSTVRSSASDPTPVSAPLNGGFDAGTAHRRAVRRRNLADTLGAVGIAGGVGVVALWLHDGGIEGFTAPGGALTEIGRVTGLLSAYLLLVQVLLMARVPWLEQTWGQDLLARRHRIIGFTSFHLMWAHIVLITLGYAAAARTGFWWQAWVLVTQYPGMLLAAAAALALTVVVALSVRAARRRLRYESWHLIHLYAYLGVGLALPHQLWTGADFVASAPAAVFWWTLWIAAISAVLLWRVGSPLYRSWRHRLRVASVADEAPGVVTVVIEGRDLGRLGVRAGQFLQWRFLAVPGATRAHPFTVSAAPTQTEMRITAKEVGAGTRSLRWLRPGTRVLIEGPFGVMRADRRSHRDVLLMAAGVGLTTMRGIAEEIADEPRGEGPGGLRTPSVVVLQRTRHRTDPLFVSEFTDLARRGNIQFRLLTGARHPGSGWWGGAPSGRIGHLDPARALIAAVPDIADREVYLCGPRDWMREVKRSLNELAVDPRVVHAEEFDW